MPKQPRHSFPISQTTSRNPFDLLHVDLWGPYSLTSVSGANYFLTIVDDFSRATWTFMLQ